MNPNSNWKMALCQWAKPNMASGLAEPLGLVGDGTRSQSLGGGGVDGWRLTEEDGRRR
jgi:hypothetical protein